MQTDGGDVTGNVMCDAVVGGLVSDVVGDAVVEAADDVIGARLEA